MINFSVVMVTCDRSPEPNTFTETMASLRRGGVFGNPHLVRFEAHDNPDLEANINVATALTAGAEQNCDWVLFLEDDIAVCSSFLESCSAFIEARALNSHRVVSFGASYNQVQQRMDQGHDWWSYHVDSFYGTQAFAIRRKDVASLVEFLKVHNHDEEKDGTCYDLLMARWCKEAYPDCPHFLTPAPSFVQHTAESSIIRPRTNIHRFETFPGEAWRYSPDAVLLI